MTLAAIGVNLSGGAHLIREIIKTPRQLSRKQIWLTVAASLLVGVAFATLSHFRLAHVIDTVHADNVVFGADTLENYRGISTGQYGVVDPRKHALAQIAFSLLTSPQVRLGLSPERSTVNTMALLVGMLAISFIILCIRVGASLPLAFVSCFFLLSTNAFAFQTGLIETYILTALVSVLGFLLVLELANHVVGRPVWCAIFAGTAAGMAGLANTPAAAIVLAYSSVAWSRLDHRSRFTRALLSVAVPCAISISCAVLPSVLRDFTHHEAPLQWARQYTNHWGSFGNFSNISLTSDYLVTVALFSWASVGVEPMCRYTDSDLLHLQHAPLAVLGLIGGLVLVAYAARRIVRDRAAWPLAAGLVSICGIFVAFYWYFNPWEGMLYASQWMLVVVYLIVLGLKRVRWATAAILVIAVALFISNEPLTWPTHETFASACPPDHLPPWEQAAMPSSP